MLRIAGRRLAGRIGGVRPFSQSTVSLAEDQTEKDAGPKAFTERFLQNMQGSAVTPQYPSDFIKKTPEASAEGVPEKLTLNFYLPHKQQVKDSKASPNDCLKSLIKPSLPQESFQSGLLDRRICHCMEAQIYQRLLNALCTQSIILAILFYLS